MPFLRIGPVLLSLVVGLQLTFWAWGRWPERKLGQAELDRLTNSGLAGYHPEYDVPIYLAGLLLSLLLAILVGLLWRYRLGRVRSADQLRSVQSILLLHFPAAALFASLPLLYVSARRASPVSGCLGLLFCGAALWAAGRSTLAMPRWLQWPRACRRFAEAVIAAVVIVLLVYIPHTTPISGEEYLLDRYHHLDFYAMAPALAYRHQMALGTDFYSQYGVAWPMILSFISKVAAPLSYRLLLRVCVVWGCLYFGALYAFLRLLFRSASWAAVGLLLALLLQLFTGTRGEPKWMWPSSTAMRYPMDIFLFGACLLHATSGKAWLGMLAGAFAALALLFGTDTGLYLTVCLAGYLLLVGRLRCEDNAHRQVARLVGWTLLGFAVVLFSGLALASRGTLFQPEFWAGWTESLRLYGAGFGNLPIVDAIRGDWTANFLLMAMLICYLCAVGRMFQEAVGRRLAPRHLIVGLIGAYGLATLLLFVGRSHPYNLHHPSVPFCIVLVSFLVEIYEAARQKWIVSESPGEKYLFCAAFGMAPFVCVYAALLAICVQPAFRSYPNALRWLVKDRMDRVGVPDENYLFLSRHDGPLPDERREDIATFRAITTTMRELSDGGRKSVAMIDCFDTAYLVEADLRPYFRYSPVVVNLVFKDQVKAIEQQIVDSPPDYLLIPIVQPTTETGILAEDERLSILNVIERHFILDRRVGEMGVYRSK